MEPFPEIPNPPGYTPECYYIICKIYLAGILCFLLRRTYNCDITITVTVTIWFTGDQTVTLMEDSLMVLGSLQGNRYIS